MRVRKNTLRRSLRMSNGKVWNVQSALDAKSNHNFWFGYREPTFVSGIATLDFASYLPSNAIIRSVLAVLNSGVTSTLVVRSTDLVSGSPLSVKIIANQNINQAYGCFVLVGYDIV